ncbi:MULTISPECIES: hypothetical protein [unclassified Streptomyces]|uniref:hypothetical protein n=1 Tax=Streptomyces TaxID=1883 RepID=UPI00136C844F|nr:MULTISPECIES: hypothetical protein [unclassified Streptomyces]NEA05073.1 hypothetical protein [Streptomyces sp. SID10116]MYY80901.1 hypothetical protein [Streptomyces sp. SID335]MYZ16900.1 hypothetical protein [Streptomyces sp. SID337]NDZ89455.1 hypothetical protein [Streptomyces sp. SID10115]NEB49089.1 hypothetical protein [Streptomyces sp. SID339]
MWSTLIAVLGTLAGAALASLTAHWVDRRARAAEHEQRVLDAVAQLLAASLAYREIYWLQIADLREGMDPTREGRADLFRARTAVTQAFDRLALATTDRELTDAANEAAWSAIDLGDIPLGRVREGHFDGDVEAALTAGRERSRDAHTALRNAARTRTSHRGGGDGTAPHA